MEACRWAELGDRNDASHSGNTFSLRFKAIGGLGIDRNVSEKVFDQYVTCLIFLLR